MRQVGAAVGSPMTLLREHATAVRALLAGETVAVQGRYVALDRVALDWPPAHPPRLLIGGRGPRTVALAGEISDGVLLDSVTDPDVVRRARRAVGGGHVAAYTPIEPGATRNALRTWVAELADAGADTVIVQGTEEQPDHLPLIEAIRCPDTSITAPRPVGQTSAVPGSGAGPVGDHGSDHGRRRQRGEASCAASTWRSVPAGGSEPPCW
jgi:hypothetical protein